MVMKIHVFLGGSRTRPGMIFSDFGVALGVHFEVQGVTFFAEIRGFFWFSSRRGSGTLFCFKNSVFCEGDFQKLAFRSRVEPIGPEKITKEASKMTPVGDTLAPLSSKTRVSENHPRKTHAF